MDTAVDKEKGRDTSRVTGLHTTEVKKRKQTTNSNPPPPKKHKGGGGGEETNPKN